MKLYWNEPKAPNSPPLVKRLIGGTWVLTPTESYSEGGIWNQGWAWVRPKRIEKKGWKSVRTWSKT